MKGPWPIGLRVVFGVVVLAFLVSTVQFVYYGLMQHTLFPDEIGGKWAFLSYVMTYVTIMVGGFGLRRPFAIAVAALCAYSIPLTAFHTWPMLQHFWGDILSGRMTIGRILTGEMWCFTWNSICLSLDTGVLLYLLSYEFHLFGPGKVERRFS